jgi:hypothetical protein
MAAIGDHCLRMVPMIGSCCTSIILKGPCVGLASLPKYGFPMSRWMRTLSLRQNSCGMHLQFLVSEAVDGVPIGSEGSWKNHVAVESMLSWACL